MTYDFVFAHVGKQVKWYSGFQMTTVQKYTKNVVAIHELPLHFLCCTQLKTAIKQEKKGLHKSTD